MLPTHCARRPAVSVPANVAAGLSKGADRAVGGGDASSHDSLILTLSQRGFSSIEPSLEVAEFLVQDVVEL